MTVPIARETDDGPAKQVRAMCARAEEDARGPRYTEEQEQVIVRARRRRAIAELDEG